MNQNENMFVLCKKENQCTNENLTITKEQNRTEQKLYSLGLLYVHSYKECHCRCGKQLKKWLIVDHFSNLKREKIDCVERQLRNNDFDKQIMTYIITLFI